MTTPQMDWLDDERRRPTVDDDIVQRINALLIACEASPCDCRCPELLDAADEIERLRALVEIGDQLVKSIRDHDLNGAVLRAWEQARRGC